MTRDEFAEGPWNEWLYKEMLMCLHAHHDYDWLARCTKGLPGKVKKVLLAAYDASHEPGKTPETKPPVNGAATTKVADANRR